MLILTRKPTQSILIGSNLYLTIGGWNAAGVHLLLYLDGQSSAREARVQIGYNWQISDNITIRVLGIEQGRAKLGFDAPRDITIDRLEVHRAKQAKRTAA